MVENSEEKISEATVDITLSGISSELLKKFTETVVKNSYATNEIGYAITDMMQEAIDRQKQKETFGRFPWKDDENKFNEACDLITLRRRYENYAIFDLGEKLASTSIDLAFRSPSTYPDAILIDLETNKTLNAEFEEYSSDFKTHGHDPSKCDLIICWIHDWNKRWANEKCPLDVFELGKGEGKGIFYPKP